MKDYQIKFIEKLLKHDCFRILCEDDPDDVAAFVACQFALESDFGRSRLAKENNNITGMRSPSTRPTLDVYPGSFPEFASFDCVNDCIIDYFLWLSFARFTQSDLQNLEAFKVKLAMKNYCPEKDYINRINSLFVQFKSLKNE